MNTAFVLAAGLGTRLRPLTLDRPKPLVPVCGIPMLAYSLAACSRAGLTDVVVNAHWLAEHVTLWRGEHEGCNVSISVEKPEILGTGGGLRRVRDSLAERFCVVNADVLADVDLRALLDAVPDGGAAMALRADFEATKYGIVAADSTGTVVELTTVARGEPVGEVRRDTHFTGIHAMHRDALELVPDGFQCIVRTAYKALVPVRKVRGLRHPGIWLDVGDPAAYLDANLTVLAGGLALPIDPSERAAWARIGGVETGDRGIVGDAEVIGDCWVGEGARIGRAAVLERSVIGAGATVAARSQLTDTVVWDNAIAHGTLRRAVVHDSGTWIG